MEEAMRGKNGGVSEMKKKTIFSEKLEEWDLKAGVKHSLLVAVRLMFRGDVRSTKVVNTVRVHSKSESGSERSSHIATSLHSHSATPVLATPYSNSPPCFFISTSQIHSSPRFLI